MISPTNYEFKIMPVISEYTNTETVLSVVLVIDSNVGRATIGLYKYCVCTQSY